MPNHCENTLTLHGTARQCGKFAREHYRTPDEWEPADWQKTPQKTPPKTHLDLGASVPLPPEPRGNFNDVGYNWCIKNWGTKWGTYDVAQDEENFNDRIHEIYEGKEPTDASEVSYNFQSAWSPPLEWAMKASILYPTMLFDMTYIDEGFNFVGRTIIRDGAMLGEWYREHDHLTDDMTDDEKKLYLDDDGDIDWEGNILEYIHNKLEESLDPDKWLCYTTVS